MKKTASVVYLAFLLCLNLGCADGSGSAAISEGQPIAERPTPVEPPPSEDFDEVLEGFVRQGAPRRATELALEYYLENLNRFDNQAYVTVVDLGIHSSKDRFFVLDMKTRRATGYVVAHGRGSDPDHDGLADRFSNVAESKASSLGFYQVSETYYGKYGYSVRMDGLSNTNSNARSRAIVVHGANYVRKGLDKMGRSWGCPALDINLSTGVIKKIRNGSLLFIYAPQFESSV